jgi:hypothetical protein
MDSNVFDKAVVMRLFMTKPGNKRAVSTSDIEVDADKALITVHKDLLDCKEFTNCTKRMSKLSQDIARLASPSPLGKGHHLIALDLVQRVDKMVLDAATEMMDILVPALMLVYPAQVKESKRRLNGLARAEDYPTAEAFQAAFVISHNYLSFGTPDQLLSIDPKIYDREVQKAKDRIDEAATAITQALAADLKAMVDRAVDRLTPDGDGKPKVFRDSLIANMTEFLGDLTARNITGNVELEALGAKARAILDGVNPDTLRVNPSIRTEVRTGFSGIQVDLNRMVSLRPKRFFEVSAEPEDAGVTAVAA